MIVYVSHDHTKEYYGKNQNKTYMNDVLVDKSMRYEHAYDLHNAIKRGEDLDTIFTMSCFNIFLQPLHGYDRPIHLACRYSDKYVVNYILNKSKGLSSTIYPRGNKGYTPLHIITKHGRYDLGERVIRRFIKHVNSVDIFSQTPMHLACIKQDYDMIKLLISMGSNIDSRNIYNRRPIELIDENNYKILALLVENGADTQSLNMVNMVALNIYMNSIRWERRKMLVLYREKFREINDEFIEKIVSIGEDQIFRHIITFI